MTPCSRAEDCYCGGRPQGYPHCDDGKFLSVGPVAVAPRCHRDGGSFAAERASETAFLSFLGVRRVFSAFPIDPEAEVATDRFLSAQYASEGRKPLTRTEHP